MEDSSGYQCRRYRHGFSNATANPLFYYTLGDAFLGLPFYERLFLQQSMWRARLPPSLLLPFSERKTVVMGEGIQKPRSAGTGVFFPRRYEQKDDVLKNPTLFHYRRQPVFPWSSTHEIATAASRPSTIVEDDFCFSSYDADFSVRNEMGGGGRKSNTLRLPTEWTY